MRRKTNPYLVETLAIAKKNSPEVASVLSRPSRRQVIVNVQRINKEKGERIIVPGKVLGSGNITRKFKVFALKFSESAEEKLKKAGCEYKTILEALKSGDKLKGDILYG